MTIDIKAKSQKLIANSFTLIFGNTGSAALSFLLSILIGRVTGETGLGVYAAALAWVFPLSLVAEFGLGTLITREVAQSPGKMLFYVHSVTQARLLMGGGLMLVLWWCAPLLAQDGAVAQGIRIAAPLVLILPFYSTFTAIFRAHQRMAWVVFLNVGMLISQVMLTAWVFANNGDIQAALIVNTLTSAGQLVAAWAVFRWRFVHLPSPQPSAPFNLILDLHRSVRGGGKISVWGLLQQGYPFAIAAILAAVQVRLNIVILEHTSGLAAVGVYTAAQRVLDAGRMLPMAVFDALFPLLSSLMTQSAKLEQTFRRVSWGLLGYGLCFGLVFWAFSDWVIGLTYGEEFALAVPTLQIMAWSLLPLTLKQARTLYWYALKREQSVNRVTLVVLALHMVLASALIPALGALGAAIATIFVEIIAMLLLWILPLRQTSDAFTHR